MSASPWNSVEKKWDYVYCSPEGWVNRWAFFFVSDYRFTYGRREPDGGVSGSKPVSCKSNRTIVVIAKTITKLANIKQL